MIRLPTLEEFSDAFSRQFKRVLASLVLDFAPNAVFTLNLAPVTCSGKGFGLLTILNIIYRADRNEFFIHVNMQRWYEKIIAAGLERNIGDCVHRLGLAQLLCTMAVLRECFTRFVTEHCERVVIFYDAENVRSEEFRNKMRECAFENTVHDIVIADRSVFCHMLMRIFSQNPSLMMSLETLRAMIIGEMDLVKSENKLV